MAPPQLDERIVDDQGIVDPGERIVADLLTEPPPTPAPAPAPMPTPAPTPRAVAADLAALYAAAVAASRQAVDDVAAAHERELQEMGGRLRKEQDSLYEHVMGVLPGAVMEAACKGHRYTTVLTFDGSDKFSEFCYLYMLKGPYKPEQRAEMRAMGVRPLLYRLRAALQPSGFGICHSWQRATNENTVVITW
jgi:hypothetical protein